MYANDQNKVAGTEMLIPALCSVESDEMLGTNDARSLGVFWNLGQRSFRGQS